MSIFLQCVITFIACISIGIHFNVKGKLLLYSALGGAVTFFIFRIFDPLGNVAIQSFLASMVASIYSETLARIIKVPATTFLIISIIPLVPGGNLYYTMKHAIDNEMMNFLTSAINTLGIAGAIALGILLISSAFRFVTVIRLPYKLKKSK